MGTVHGLELLQSFATWLNSIHESLQFTKSSPSLEGTKFLDTFIFNKGYKLNTKVYSKPCDNHSFLVPTSCLVMRARMTQIQENIRDGFLGWRSLTTSCHATHIVENIPKDVAPGEEKPRTDE